MENDSEHLRNTDPNILIAKLGKCTLEIFVSNARLPSFKQ